jgi:hypothetical protein
MWNTGPSNHGTNSSSRPLTHARLASFVTSIVQPSLFASIMSRHVNFRLGL